ncbi:HEPN domain-containing protein [Pseudomonas sp. NPDC087342]|uniref:HEPN domain-containing protein n=1 Tax=Pseudomonas sp. NPDC087342 TaxID=3364437 RepID=UPI003815FDAB
MSTFLQDFTLSLDSKWAEIDTLISRAKELKDEDAAFYNAICRSTTVLIVAHLEGFTKDLIKNVVADLNRSDSFVGLPKAVKRTYCVKYIGSQLEGDSKSYNKKIENLIGKFDDLNSKISHEPFFYSRNKNPSSSALITAFENFGIVKVFDYLHESELDVIFSSSVPEAREKSSLLKSLVVNGSEDYPYKIVDLGLGIVKKKASKKTLWEEFVDQINAKRHLVAHGNEFDNNDDVSELERRRVIVELLQYALIAIMIENLNV